MSGRKRFVRRFPCGPMAIGKKVVGDRPLGVRRSTLGSSAAARCGIW